MNLTKILPNFSERHYLNKGDALIRTYQRVVETLWTRERGVKSYCTDLIPCSTETLETIRDRTVVQMGQAAIEAGLMLSASNKTSNEIFNAYKSINNSNN